MARQKWNHLWSAAFLIFFSLQGITVIRYASNLESQVEDGQPQQIGAVRLLSRANVSSEITSYRKIIDSLNEAQFIRNSDVLGRWSKNSTAPVFVIQVHDRVTYLEALIGALRTVKGIESSLLIFSHDLCSKEINALIWNITFVRVLQIYYPYSSQLYPYGYPGPDPAGAVLPAGYGRTAGLTQIKLHWIWKLTRVFREISVLRNHTGSKIFLEEDHYVLPDILDALAQTEAMKRKSCPSCLIILGGYPKERLWHNLEWGVVRLSQFFAGGNNMGMVLDRLFWDNFVECGREFCTVDDYNWDWTLQHLHVSCLKEPLRILKLDAPRVWHVGACGTHTKQKWKCKRLRVLESIRKVDSLIEDNKASLFQPSLRMISTLKTAVPKTPGLFGGWGDPRDHSMCMAILRDG